MIQVSKTLKSPPKDHQAIADEWNLDMNDPFTRMFVAAMYWQEQAIYWKRKAEAA